MTLDDILLPFFFEPCTSELDIKISERIKELCPGDYDAIATATSSGITVEIKYKDPSDASFYRLKYDWMNTWK